MYQDPVQAEAQKIRLVVADGYDIVECIGTGANGSVYKAEEKLSGLVSAIKFLNEQKDSEDVKRFQREAQVIAKLSHPNIVSMRSFGMKDGSPYLVMEYIEGQSLASLLKSSGTLPPERTCELMLQVCDALQHAHDQHIFHRDIKPSNIMLTQLGNREVAKLADFGIAKIKSQETRETLTQTGVVLGTPLYMSPEQSMGHQPDARSDIIYSLGCVMYECLTGRAPIEGDNFLEIVYKRLNERVPTFQQLGVNVPASLARIVFRCLAHEPNMRYQSAREVADDIRAALAGGQVAPAPRSVPKRAGTAGGAKGPLIAYAVILTISVTITRFVLMSSIHEQPSTTHRYSAVTIKNQDCRQLSLHLNIRGGQLGKSVDADAIRPATLGDAAYSKALHDPGFDLLMSEWKSWYSDIFDSVNPPPAGKGPVIPQKMFGSFDVTITQDGSAIVTPNLQVPDAESTKYAAKIKNILESTPKDRLAMPQPVQQVKFRLEVTGSEGRFDLIAFEQPIMAE